MTEMPHHPGFDPDGTAETEADYFGNCTICGAFIDTRDLAEVLAHVAEIEIGEGLEPPRSMLT